MADVAIAPIDNDFSFDGSLQSADGAYERGFSTAVPPDECRQAGCWERGVEPFSYAVATIAYAEMLEEEQGERGMRDYS